MSSEEFLKRFNPCEEYFYMHFYVCKIKIHFSTGDWMEFTPMPQRNKVRYVRTTLDLISLDCPMRCYIRKLFLEKIYPKRLLQTIHTFEELYHWQLLNEPTQSLHLITIRKYLRKDYTVLSHYLDKDTILNNHAEFHNTTKTASEAILDSCFREVVLIHKFYHGNRLEVVKDNARKVTLRIL